MKLFINIISLFSLLFVFFGLNIIPHIDVPFKVFLICKTLIYLLLIKYVFTIIKIYFYEIKNDSVKTAIISLMLIGSFTLTLEIVFTFIPRSHGVGYTYASKLWFQKYWKNTINSYGFRDSEPVFSDSIILFVGDSFTAGHGIKKIEERVSNVVDKNIPNYNSINMGMNGADTKKEFKMMLEFIKKNSFEPKKIVLQYFGNDIEHSAYFYGEKNLAFKAVKSINFYIKQIINGSCLINYLYWLSPDKGKSSPYFDFLSSAYNDDKILNNHLEDLSKFINFSSENDIELIIVVYPFLNNITVSQDLYVRKILNHFESQNVKTINVSELIYNIPAEKLVINSSDSHPTPFLNSIVAKKLTEVIKNSM